ncbi:MAG: AsnC family transcriptional regulator, partial [Pseudomonadota bacterium]
MDKTDNQLLAALRADARASHSTLAATLGLSRATVRARIDKMVARSDIV